MKSQVIKKQKLINKMINFYIFIYFKQRQHNNAAKDEED